MHSFHSTRLAVIFDNFGPYHLARLHAAAGVCDLLAVEVSGRSAEYAWTKAATTTKFRRATLFEEKSAKATSGWEVWQNLERVLSQFQPQVVAVPGWSSSAAFGALRWCASAGVPALTMSESTSWDEKRVAWKEWIKRRLVRLGSSALVGGSPHRDYMVQLGMPQDRVFLGYDAVVHGFARRRPAEIRRLSPDLRPRSPGFRPPARVQTVFRIAGLLQSCVRIHSPQHDRAMGFGCQRSDGVRIARAGFQPMRVRCRPRAGGPKRVH